MPETTSVTDCKKNIGKAKDWFASWNQTLNKGKSFPVNTLRQKIWLWSYFSKEYDDVSRRLGERKAYLKFSRRPKEGSFPPPRLESAKRVVIGNIYRILR